MILAIQTVASIQGQTRNKKMDTLDTDTFNIHRSVHRWYTRTVQPTRCNVSQFISVRRSTCFRRFFRPSSGAQNCTYSIRYWSDQYCYLLLAWLAVLVWQIPDPVCTVLSSWWWTENPSETCRASYRNKLWNVASCWLYCANIMATCLHWKNEECQDTYEHILTTPSYKYLFYHVTYLTHVF